MRVLIFPQEVLIVIPSIKLYYYSRLKFICIYDDIFVSQNARHPILTDAGNAKPALVHAGALVQIGVVIAMLIKKRTVESVNMKVSRNKRNLIFY